MTNKTIGFGVALAVFAAMLSFAPAASAQVIIQGEVTVSPSQPQPYAQPQPYGYTQPQSAYVQTGASPQPTRYIHHSDPITGLVVGGVISLVGGWVFTLVSEGVLAGGYTSGCSGYGCPDGLWYGLTWIPVIGPWLGLGVGYGGDYEWVNYVGGILQDVGLLLMILGLVITDEWDEPILAFGDSPDAPALYLTGNGAQLTF